MTITDKDLDAARRDHCPSEHGGGRHSEEFYEDDPPGHCQWCGANPTNPANPYRTEQFQTTHLERTECLRSLDKRLFEIGLEGRQVLSVQYINSSVRGPSTTSFFLIASRENL